MSKLKTKCQKSTSKYRRSIQWAPIAPQKSKEKTQKGHLLTRPYLIHKIYNRRRIKIYKQIESRSKITQKFQFNFMNRMLNIFKCPTIHFLLDCPKKNKGPDLHIFFLFLPTLDLCQLVSFSFIEEERTKTCQSGKIEVILIILQLKRYINDMKLYIYIKDIYNIFKILNCKLYCNTLIVSLFRYVCFLIKLFI